MPVEIDGVKFLEVGELLKRLRITRQTLWRWRQKGLIPSGHRYRGRQVVFSPQDAAAIEEYANRIEAIDNSNGSQLRLFNDLKPKS